MFMSEQWPFDQGPNVAAITTRQVLEDGLPVLKVTHFFDDDSWGFFCGTTNKTEDLKVIAMEEALNSDPNWCNIRSHCARDACCWHDLRPRIHWPWGKISLGCSRIIAGCRHCLVAVV
jgi:hypothetical protein